MLDIKLIRSNEELVEENLARRGKGFSLAEIIELDAKRRLFLGQVEEKKNRRKTVSKEIGALKAKGEDPKEIMEAMALLRDEVDLLDEELRKIDEALEQAILVLPNLLDETVPVGKTEDDNLELRKVGTLPTFSFEPLDHHTLGTNLGLIDFERGTKVSGSKFVFMKGKGARLERSLINLMLDMHAKNGYEEIVPPFLVNDASLTGTGQLPKFGEDMFTIEGRDLSLVPTAEVPLTNYYRDDILKEEDLPVRFCAYSPCFRSEAGSAGRDTRGLIRLHQFNKVEMVHFVHPTKSKEALEEITGDAEAILKALGLAYRVVRLCSGDTGFGSALTYDLEVYLPSYGTYKEISSCSLYNDFQSRRAKIRFKNKEGKNQFLHTLNGSGLAVGRTVAAILENYQRADGRVVVPEVLRPYLGEELL